MTARRSRAGASCASAALAVCMGLTGASLAEPGLAQVLERGGHLARLRRRKVLAHRHAARRLVRLPPTGAQCHHMLCSSILHRNQSAHAHAAKGRGSFSELTHYT